MLEDRSWILEFGTHARIVEPVEDYKLVQSIRVFYGLTEAEFGITEEAWIRTPMDEETAAVITAGFQVLFDPDDRLAAAVAHAAEIAR